MLFNIHEHVCVHCSSTAGGGGGAVMSSCLLQHQLRDEKQERGTRKKQEVENETIINGDFFRGRERILFYRRSLRILFLLDNVGLLYEKHCSVFP